MCYDLVCWTFQTVKSQNTTATPSKIVKGRMTNSIDTTDVVIRMSTGIGKRVLHSQIEWKMFVKPVYFITQFIYSFRTVTLAGLSPLEHVEC